LLSLGYLAAALRFAGNPNRLGARNLFLASIAYLPLLIIVMAIDKTV
jgi:heme O synthase-like polyprenyltransferase